MLRTSLKAFWAVLALQIIFAVIIPIATSTKLSSNGACLLNEAGSTCLFLELSSGFSLLFSLLLAIGAAVAARHRTPLDADVASVAAFAGLWWLVAAITATQRGQQASDAGLAQRSARDAVIALSWLEFVLFVAAYAVTAYERIMHCRARIHLKASSSQQEVPRSPAAADRKQADGKQGQFLRQSYEPPAVPPPAAIVTAV